MICECFLVFWVTCITCSISALCCNTIFFTLLCWSSVTELAEGGTTVTMATKDICRPTPQIVAELLHVAILTVKPDGNTGINCHLLDSHICLTSFASELRAIFNKVLQPWSVAFHCMFGTFNLLNIHKVTILDWLQVDITELSPSPTSLR